MKKKALFLIVALVSLSLASFSQVIQAPSLQCGIDSSSNGNITLRWSNPPANGCGAFVQYTIYASSNGPNGPYNPIAVTNQAATSFVLTNYLSISSDWYFYMETQYNCPGATVLQSDTISNHAPLTPVIVNVDVTTDGKVVFKWQQDPSPQTLNYRIYRYYSTNGFPQPLDTIYGRGNTTFIDSVNNPDVQSLSYTISASDSCGQTSAYNVAPQNTIYLTAHVVQCRRNVQMDWNKYINWPQGVKEYQILVSRNDSAFRYVTSVDSGTLTYGYSEFNDGDSLCLVVRAVSAADTTVDSHSNMVCLKASIVQPPAYNYITNVTVDAANHIEITWMIDTLGQLISYRIDRGSDTTTLIPYQSFNTPSPLQHFQTYIDTTAFPQNNAYYYKITALDSCNNQYASSIGGSINLQGQLFDFYVADLSWNQFSLFGATVLHYNIYRDFGNGYQLIKTLPDGTGQYVDSLQQFLNERGVFCYKVEAVYTISLPNGYTNTDSSWSNEVCITHHPIIYIPNVFHPGSSDAKNSTFQPYIIYGDPKFYSMTIYNRWGGEVFSTNVPPGSFGADVPGSSWDGTDHGKAAEMGGYGYIIRFTADDGVVVTKTGIVLLVR